MTQQIIQRLFIHDTETICCNKTDSRGTSSSKTNSDKVGQEIP
jgi:hypothetical protein